MIDHTPDRRTRLPHTDDNLLHLLESLQQAIGDCLSQRFDQKVLLPENELFDRIIHPLVVDRLLKIVGVCAAAQINVQVDIDFKLAAQRLLIG